MKIKISNATDDDLERNEWTVCVGEVARKFTDEQLDQWTETRAGPIQEFIDKCASYMRRL